MTPVPFPSVDTELAGARESNAGDDFHILWATRRALGLLDQSADLASVTVEELSPADEEHTDSASTLGVDLTEYFGGGGFASARRVVVSQLKYSARNPSRPWTAARLAKPPSKGASVVRRLAEVYSELARNHPRKRVLQTLQVRFVSNRPAGAELRQAVLASQRWLEQRPGRVASAHLLQALGPAQRAPIQRLYDASGLASYAFADFLRVLELAVGQQPSDEQELAITAALGQHVRAGLQAHSRAVYDLVRRRALPPGRRKPIRRSDVLAALGVYDEDALLPAPSSFHRPPLVIPTPEPRSIVDALQASPTRMLLAHGYAGVGKTTSVLQIASELPPNSTVIHFDCFAGGAYLAPARARHTPERALVHVSNELAIGCRLPMLLVPPASDADLWRELQVRLDAAARTATAAGANVMLVFDAIDNAVWAAETRRERSFVPDLWRLSVPDGAYLLATARTARRDTLELPANLPQLPLTGFDETASTAYLRTRFAEATDHDGARFHVRSQGNPRVQKYVVDPDREQGPTSVAQAVEQAKRTPSDIFEDLLGSAIEQAPDAEWARERLADLLCLNAPITLSHMARTADADKAPVRAFCEALVPGLRIAGEVVTIQDEDFETFLQGTLDAAGRTAAHSRLATLFLEERSSDAYAATVVADHLDRAERHQELITLAIEEGQPRAIADPLMALQTYRRRLRLASQAAADVGATSSAARLLTLAAQATSSDRAITRILRSEPELALAYGDPDSVAAVWRSDDDLEWQGPVHMRQAAHLARRGSVAEAAEALSLANAWLAMRRDREHTFWELGADDLAAGLEAIWLSRDPQAALERLGVWGTGKFNRETARLLMERLRVSAQTPDVTTALFSSDLKPTLTACCLTAFVSPRDELYTDKMRALAERLIAEGVEREDPANWHFNRYGEQDPQQWRVGFAELVAGGTRDIELTLRLLNAIGPVAPAHAPGRHEGVGRFLPPLRAVTLRAVCEARSVQLAELMPSSVTDESDGSNEAKTRRSEERETVKSALTPLLAVYELRATTLIHGAKARELMRPLARELANAEKISGQAWSQNRPRFGSWVRPVCDTLLLATGAAPSLVRRAADAAIQGPSDTWVWQELASTLISDSRYRREALSLINRAADTSEGRSQPPRELAEFLLELANVTTSWDADVAADLYSRAVDTARELDDESIGALTVHAELAPSLAGHPKAPELAARIDSSLSIYRSRVSDEDYLPWAATLRGIASMHPPSGLALLSRWEDTRDLRLPRSVAPVAQAGMRRGFLSASDVLAMLGLAGEATDRADAALPALDQLEQDRAPALAGELEYVSLAIRRDLTPRARHEAAQTLSGWAREHGRASMEAIRALMPYVDTPPSAPPASNYSLAREGRSSAPALLRAASGRSPATLAKDLDTLWREHGVENSTRRYLDAMAQAQAPRNRTAFLDALTNLPPEHVVMHFESEVVLDLVRECLDRWGRQETVKRWREEQLPKFLVRQLPNVVRYPEAKDDQLPLIAQLVSGDAQALLAAQAGSHYLSDLSAGQLYALAGLVIAGSDSSERHDFLDWSLQALEGDDEEDRAPVVGEKSREEVLASLLWALFANPEKDVRWRAAHCARRLLTNAGGDPALARALLEKTSERSGGAWVDADLAFLWMSAQMWVYMVLARVADDNPAVVEGLHECFAEAALSTQWPHASVREFAKRAAERTLEITDEDARQRLELANRPRAWAIERESLYAAARPPDDEAGDRWHFDMDTESYWFSFLGRRFGLHESAIASRAETWLIDRLALSPDTDAGRDDSRLERLDYSAFGHHHGSVPRAESGRLAMEYHAMLLVAGELADSDTPLLIEPYEPLTDSWREWLDGHVDSNPSGWAVEQRTPTPANAVLINPGEFEHNHWPPVDKAVWDFMLGVDAPEDELVVDGYVEYNASAGYGYDTVRSALVDRATAPSLVRALSRAEQPSFFPMPGDEDDPYGNAVDQPPFRLLGWLRELHSSTEGLEDHDPLARLGASVDLPGSRFLDFHSAWVEGHRVLASGGNVLAYAQQFSDRPLNERSDYARELTTSGHQTFVSREALQPFLGATDTSLIIRLACTRRDRDSFGRRSEHDQEIHKVFVLTRTGKLLTERQAGATR